MNKLSKIAVTSVTGIALAISIVSPAYAWHPEGKIVKSVRNVTSNGQLSDANSAGSAVAAIPGDTLLYSITLTNTAAPAEKQYNDLAFVVLKDTLPEGVELISNPSQRSITEDLGTIVPGKSVTKQYSVKVTAATSGKLIENKACFTGNSVVKDAPRSGCDVAVIKVNVPVAPITTVKPTPAPVTVVTAPTPAPVVTPTPVVAAVAVTETPAVLPATGPAGMIVFGALATIAGYIGNIVRLRSRVQA